MREWAAVAARVRRIVGFLAAGALLGGLAVGLSAGASEGSSWPPPLAPVLLAAWQQGLAAEQREELEESSRHYELLARALPESPTIRWRIARNFWRLGERLPVEDRTGRLELFHQSERWADAALETDPKCGECVMWKIAAMGRVATTSGVFESASRASKIAELIEYGIALNPTHADSEANATLGNLYYAGSAFYRVVPDWFWLKLLIGVRGDNERALEYIRKAIEISENRLDYQVELGAVLLCIGSDDDDPMRITEGRDVLRHAVKLENFQSTDSLDREHAHVLIAAPERACGYSRDGWIDLTEAVEH